MTVDSLQPYGALIESRLRLITWNVWGRFGPWEQRRGCTTTGFPAIARKKA